MLEAIGDTTIREQHRIDQLIEEAINSSLVEGAKLSTRAQAKDMIRGGLKPTSKSERMVLNNYLAMSRLLELTGRELALDDLLEIHAILGADALESADAEGRLRTDNENVRVEDAVTGDVWFVPPAAAGLREQLARMLDFANAADSEPFVHPLLRAIVLHFWLAYLHPFVDGNGRMARALFYWKMLRAGYDFAQFLSISGPIDRAPRSYYLAFAYTETDGGDLTYFILNQLRVLDSATDALVNHLREHGERLTQLSAALSASETLNHRQRSVLAMLVRQPHQVVTVATHKASHTVSYLTARKDLQDLELQGLLRRTRAGKTDRYFPTDRLLARFATR
jgi:Fic family protein